MEAGKLEHRVARHDPQLAAFLSVAAPMAGVIVAAWAGPKLVRFLKVRRESVRPESRIWARAARRQNRELKLRRDRMATSKKVAREAGHELKTDNDKKEKSVAASALSPSDHL